ncbi:MAG: TetR/AcrR family transcriptional regulator [Anaerolineae bacterium]|nr:TetR/AcrR family transcriptional regulator [Anaerolineae bacterium]MDQ7036046.1 TetR/AcrR family transcriptional regulator [Anaerolineae bacterium]
MPRPRDEAARQETIQQIKAIARQQMADNGTAGISLRAIARQMGVTAPAIYNYFSRLDNLITALIVDAFNGLGDAVQDAVQSQTNLALQFKTGANAYRQWALDHAADFQLIYGNPIPGYEAPSEVTVPLAIRPLVTFYTTLFTAWQVGEVTIPQPYKHIPPTVKQFMKDFIERDVPQIAEAPTELFYLLHVAWSRFHGMVMLELFHHSPASLGDPTAFYKHEVDVFLREIGFAIA